ncbi:uncharacterized protein FIBRA_09529 [Fibroporia radiculosa]|uniref:Cytochrome P450 n=1 Tax=Fibroporia radiculosa TaxID=599839 RepID=J7SD52_9APHY|nr:uncharacterized protein FIBRA_09529 [Fibroporia radiculosa]CCM07188.1 predicted protein [Fibroporia radiculosa]
MSSVELVFLVSIVASTLVAFYFNHVRPRGSLPPGPVGIPLLGNLLQVNALRPHPQFREWAARYGPIFSLRMGPQQMIVLNTAEAADELLVNRSKVYSSRSPPHVAQDIVSDGQRMVLLPYDREWKIVRRSVHSVLSPAPSKRLREMQELESRVVLYDLLTHGDTSVRETFIQGPNWEVPERHWFSILRRYTTSVVMHMAYGQRIHRIVDNPNLHKIYNVMANFTRVAQPGSYLLDDFVH